MGASQPDIKTRIHTQNKVARFLKRECGLDPLGAACFERPRTVEAQYVIDAKRVVTLMGTQV